MDGQVGHFDGWLVYWSDFFRELVSWEVVNKEQSMAHLKTHIFIKGL